MKQILILFSLALLVSCNQTTNNKKVNSQNKVEINPKEKVPSFPSDRIEKLKAKCAQGDSEAFGNLVDYYANNPSEESELLEIATMMADKYNNDNARVTIYYQTIMKNNNGKRDDSLFFKLKEKDKDFVVSHLINGLKNKNAGCIAILKKIVKGGYKIKNNNQEIENLLKQ